MMTLHRLFPDNTYVAMGLHPTEVRENWRDELDYFMDLLHNDSSEYVAVGEVGIDLYWDRTFEKEQMTVFEEQVRVSCELDMPLLIHCWEDGLGSPLKCFRQLVSTEYSQKQILLILRRFRTAGSVTRARIYPR